MVEHAPPGRTNAVPIAEELEDANFDVAPPAYSDHHDRLRFTQAGFAADAAVTADGRVNIHINEKNRRLSELLAPALKRQLHEDARLPSGPLPPPYIPPSLGGQPGQTPPPRLNVVIQIVGSRGDVQPFVALGQVLRDTYGHRVRLATHATFRSFVEENGLEFFNIGGDPAELMAFMVKHPGLMPGLDALKKGEIRRRRQEIQEILMGCWRSCIEAGDGTGIPPPQQRRDEPLDERFMLPGDPSNRPFVADAIIANPPSFAHIHVAEKLGIPLHMMFTMPWSATRAFPHPLADIVSTNTDAAITNYVSYALVEMMTWQGLGDIINRFRTNLLELDPISLIWAPGLLSRLRVPTTYCWSPALTPKPADWAPEITVSGFYFLNLESSYTPEPELAGFLDAGPPPVYIGFGSIVVDDPDALTRTVFNAIVKAGVRAIVSKGWGGIGGDAADIPEGVFMLGNCPHDWLFKHVSAVIHHGGAGTTAAGIKAGRPTVVVPFFGDQVFWGSMVARAGAGPAPIPYKKLTAENLAAAIEEALRPETQARARELGEKIKEEKGADVGGKSFHQFLNADNIRCSLAPSRVAVWRVRRSKVRLSALAACVLVKQGWLKYTDLKLYRPIEYNTDEQPWDPISAVILALAGEIGGFTMALADFPREVFSKGGPSKKDGDTPDLDEQDAASGSQIPIGSSQPHQRAEGSGSETPSTSSPPRTAAHGSVETLSSSSALSPNTGLSPRPTTASSASTGFPPAHPPPSRGSSPNPSASTAEPLNLDLAVAAGKGVGRVVGAGMKFSANICLGLARGFRNAPRLYNDETVRPPEKVTGLVSGIKVAGKEFGYGLFDGVSGLVVQPWKGAEREGGRGLLKGMGKGIGGLLLKPAAAVCALPAYAMQGVRTEFRNLFARSSANYIVTSRVLQGEEDWGLATAEERRDVLARWQTKREELKGFYLLKQRESEKARVAAEAVAPGEFARLGAAGERLVDNGERVGGGAAALDGPPLSSPRTSGWRDVKWNRRPPAVNNAAAATAAIRPGTGVPPPPAASLGSSDFSFEDNESLERAIRQSVVQTSRGDREEDARVEAAVRASVMEMCRQQQQISSEGRATWERAVWEGDRKELIGDNLGQPEGSALTDADWTNVTDEEYQALVEEAVRQSLLQHEAEREWRQRQRQQQQQQQHWPAPGEETQTSRSARLPTEPQQQPPAAVHELPGDLLPPAGVNVNDHRDAGAGTRARERIDVDDGDEDEQLRRAIQDSAREDRIRREAMERQRTEEEIVLEYVKRQSLVEEEYRRAAEAASMKGKAPVPSQTAGPVPGPGGRGGDEEDEDLRRALEESLRLSRGSGGDGGGGRRGSGGPSRSGP